MATITLSDLSTSLIELPALELESIRGGILTISVMALIADGSAAFIAIGFEPDLEALRALGETQNASVSPS